MEAIYILEDLQLGTDNKRKWRPLQVYYSPAKSAPVYVPGKSCTCGAQRVGVTKHYSYCDLGVTDVQEP